MINCSMASIMDANLYVVLHRCVLPKVIGSATLHLVPIVLLVEGHHHSFSLIPNLELKQHS